MAEQKVLRARDTISGQEGRAYATINGNKEEMFYVKKLEAKVEKEKAEIKALGRRGTQSKAKGWKGTGSMTIYYITTLFRDLMREYMVNGRDTYFDITVSNEDPSSSVGMQTVIIKNVNLDSVIMASLDTGSDALEEEIAFTFDGIEIKDRFNAPTAG
ncbi:Phage tail tube protein [Paenibacillus tianmuensis]|uniref:Phage tail tube protein n=1 Tax=Paenibacillus tianmuensis TaxID=624147 RepID=A0A1G4RKF4_9BACL|nr:MULTISPECIES: phage tail tube protein [Paenibacillus]MCP3773657.1 phage tail tube protein [Paenibacillus sp. MZ04-78.2]SCW57227.1 Phage tail tube protein [Paenibacillus tianmuensis]